LLFGENEAELEKKLETKDKAFVLFYESWCPYSKRFLPVFEKFAKTQSRECMKVVADYKLRLCDKFSVEVFPTVLFFERCKVTKRLDGKARVGLNQQQLDTFAKQC